MAEEARLESVYTSKAYPEFESRSFRKSSRMFQNFETSDFFLAQVEIPHHPSPEEIQKFQKLNKKQKFLF